VNPELSVVLPAWKEAENLEWLLPELRAVLEGLGVTWEILVIDAPEPVDPTGEVCRAAGVRCVPRRGGTLYGDAVRTGLAEARGAWIVMMDADGSHETGQVARLWAARARADLLIASRYVAGGQTENPAVLIGMSLAVNVVFRLVLHLSVRDVSNSFRLYRAAPLRALRLECDNFDIVEEILVKLCADPSLRVLELPTTFARRRKGETKRDLRAFAVSYLATLRRLRRLQARAREDRR
jgi:dolichol-phosphate mannosyltransferase